MQAIAQKWVIPRSRHLAVDLPPSVPEGPVDVVLVFGGGASDLKSKPGIGVLIGSMREAAAFKVDSVQLQRALRDEW
jgi:hypothetical protein